MAKNDKLGKLLLGSALAGAAIGTLTYFLKKKGQDSSWDDEDLEDFDDNLTDHKTEDDEDDDEYDEEEEIIDKIDDNIYLVDGDVDLDDLDEELGIDLVSETSETIGGFIIDMLGEIPDENDVGRIVEFENYQFKIMAIQDRRIERVKIYILPKETEENSASESDEEE